jgi:hypothetical protein
VEAEKKEDLENNGEGILTFIKRFLNAISFPDSLPTKTSS